MKTYQSQKVCYYVQKVLEGNGVPSGKAKTVANVLIEADLRSIYSHGINNLDILIVNSIKAGAIDPEAVPVDSTRDKSLCIRHINAMGDLGYCAAMDAVGLVQSLARKYGMGKVYITNTNHFGALAIYSEKIAEDKDLVGRVTCTTPSIMRPYGGTKNRLGTNPLSISIPYDQGIITIDMATTIHAVSEINRAILEMKHLPFPVLDQNGMETTNPHAFLDPADFVRNGSMMPLGSLAGEKGIKTGAGYKGSGLAIVIELDNVIGGGKSGKIDPTGHNNKRRIRQTFEAYRIDSLFSKKEVLKEISETVKDIRKFGPSAMYMPGEKEQRQRNKSLRVGITYSNTQIQRLEKLGKEVGLPIFSKFNI